MGNNQNQILALDFGTTAPPLLNQINSQGFKVDAFVIKAAQQDADAVARLHDRSLLPASQVHLTRMKILRKLWKVVSPA